MLITNARVFTFGAANEMIEDGAIRVEGDRITDVGPSSALRTAFPREEMVDAGGQLAMPANICAHTHFYGAFSRGMAIPGAPARDLPEIAARARELYAAAWDRYSSLGG